MPESPNPNLIQVDLTKAATAVADKIPWAKLTAPVVGSALLNIFVFVPVIIMYMTSLNHNKDFQSNVWMWSGVGGLAVNILFSGLYLLLAYMNWRNFVATKAFGGK